MLTACTRSVKCCGSLSRRTAALSYCQADNGSHRQAAAYGSLVFHVRPAHYAAQHSVTSASSSLSWSASPIQLLVLLHSIRPLPCQSTYPPEDIHFLSTSYIVHKLDQHTPPVTPPLLGRQPTTAPDRSDVPHPSTYTHQTNPAMHVRPVSAHLSISDSATTQWTAHGWRCHQHQHC